MLFKELKEVLPRDQFVSLFVTDPNGPDIFCSSENEDDHESRTPVYLSHTPVYNARPKTEDYGNWILTGNKLDKLNQPHYIPGYFDDFVVEVIRTPSYGRRDELLIKLAPND